MKGFMCDGECDAFHAGVPAGTYTTSLRDDAGRPVPVEAHFCEACAHNRNIQFRLVDEADVFADDEAAA